MSFDPLVSVIIPTRNEEKDIKDCLESIKRQSYRKKEVIIVDGGSTDRTVEIVKKYGAIVLEENPPKGPANARNIGSKKAKGQIVFFIDADGRLDKNAIKEAVKVLQQSNLDGLSPNTRLYPTKKLIPNLYFAERLSAKMDMSPSVIWKKIFLKVLFDPNLGVGEDYDMCQRFVKMGLKYQFARNVVTYHKEPNLKRLLSESEWWGRTYFSLLSKKHYGNFLSFIWTIFVALLVPFSIISMFFDGITNVVLFFWVVYISYSFFKILRAIRNGAKFRYAILIPFFKIFRYTFLLIGIIIGVIKRSKFKGE